MTQMRGQWWRFLRALPAMPLFQMGIILIIFCLPLAMWFYERFIDASQDGTMLAVLLTVATSTAVIIGTCYQTFLGKWTPPNTAAAVQTIKIEIALGVPLPLAAILALYFLAHGQTHRVAIIIWPAIILWLVLRLILNKLGK